MGHGARIAGLIAAAVLLGTSALVLRAAERGDGRPPGAGAPPGGKAGAAPGLAAAAAAVHEPPPAVRTDHKVPFPMHKRSSRPPGSRWPVTDLPKVDDGIPLPDGTFLPFLNGMNWAPPVQRDRSHGDVPPVVAILVDADGFEWYEHADGSVTTCMYQQVVVQGETYWDPTTKHSVPVPPEMLRADDRPDGGRPH